MSETRVYLEPNNTLHIAEVARRRRERTVWFYVALVLLAIPILVGLIDVLMRAESLLTTAHAQPLSQLLSTDADVLPAFTGTNPAQSPTASATQTLVPTRLKIPAIGVDAAVESVDLNVAGAMKAPSNFTDVGWYQDGAKPGGNGSAVFDGHVNNALTKAGVFEHLAQLSPGDQIEVSDASGRTLMYTIQSVKTYAVASAPEAEIFSTAGPSQLALITCDGIWNESQHQYSNRLVVYAELSN